METLPKLRDIGWSHGEMVGGNTSRWMCNWCGLTRYGGGVTRLKKHLAGASDVKKCPSVPDDIAKSIMHDMMEKQKRRKKRSARWSGIDETGVVLNDDITNISFVRSNNEMQVASAGRYNRSNKTQIDSKKFKNAGQKQKITSQLHETAKVKVLHFNCIMIFSFLD